MIGWLIFELAITGGLFVTLFYKNEWFKEVILVLWFSFLVVNPVGIYPVIRVICVVLAVALMRWDYYDRRLFKGA